MKNFIAKEKTIFVDMDNSKRSWKICVRSENMTLHETTLPAQYSNLNSYLYLNIIISAGSGETPNGYTTGVEM
ncbi:MAG: hypothetical protein KAW56_08995 [Candidatus Marinimicrobia bacterium]|nr:hypothetical protein [Candidatus Neomarinimicrobiota bacterium]